MDLGFYIPASTPGADHPYDPDGQIIKLYIGRDGGESIFEVRESTLDFYSTFFFTLSASSMHLLNRTNNMIRLPSEDPNIFDIALQYILHRNQPLVEDLGFDNIVALYSLGLRRYMPLIQNLAVDLFVMKIKSENVLPDRWAVHYLWETSLPGTKMRICLVELMRAMWTPEGHRAPIWRELVGGMSADCEQLVWVMDEFCSEGPRGIRVSERTARRWQACEWHEHEVGVFCEGSEEARLGIGGREDGETGRGVKRRWSET